MSTVLFDVGGTNTRIATIEDNNLKLLDKVDTEQQANPVEFLKDLITSYFNLEQVDSVVLALPGEIQDSLLVYAQNLPSWRGIDYKSLTDGKIELINDADAAALGEAHYGAGKELSRFGYVTISTGIGGGLIEHGRLADQQLGFEVGKQVVDWQSGHSLESLAGGASIKQRTGKLTGQITSDTELNIVALQLASGIFNTALLWSTNELVINGPSLFESEKLYQKILDQFNKIVASSGLHQQINVNLAKCGDDAGLYGCMHLAKNS